MVWTTDWKVFFVLMPYCSLLSFKACWNSPSKRCTLESTVAFGSLSSPLPQVVIHRKAHIKRAHQRLAIGQAGSPFFRQDRGGTRTGMVIVSTEGNHGAVVSSCCREVASWLLSALLA